MSQRGRLFGVGTVALFVSFLSSCRRGIEPEPPPRPGPPALMSLIGGPISAPVGTTVDVTVKVTDAGGTPVPSYLVNFIVISGRGTLFVPAVLTSAAGEAKNKWTLGPTAGEQVIEARAIDPETGQALVFERATATAQPGPAAAVRFQLYDLARFVGFREALSRLVAAAGLRVTDAHGNARPVSEATLSASPDLALGADSATRATPGTGFIVARVGSVRDSVSMSALEDFRQGQWRLTHKCAGFRHRAICQDCDSIVVTSAVESVVYLSLPGQGAGASFSFITNPVMTDYRKDTVGVYRSDRPFRMSAVQRRADVLVLEGEIAARAGTFPTGVYAYSGQATLTRRGDPPSTFSGGHFCGYFDDWAERSPVVLGPF